MASRRFDEWGHHPASFAFPALELAVEAASGQVGGGVIDPFVGSGKAATFVTGRGDAFVGIEAHPLTVRLAKLKLARPGPAEDLRAAGAQLAERAARTVACVDTTTEQELVRRFIPAGALPQLVAAGSLLAAETRSRCSPKAPGTSCGAGHASSRTRPPSQQHQEHGMRNAGFALAITFVFIVACIDALAQLTLATRPRIEGLLARHAAR